MDLSQQIITYIAENEGGLGLVLIGIAALLEYIFPPFPGDSVTLFGAFLVTRRGWSGPAVFSVILLGSAIGLMLDYAAGRSLADFPERLARSRLRAVEPHLRRLIARFERHGALYLAINRFIPSLRALFFVAAGMARLPALGVLAWGLVSATAWNALLYLAGATLGHKWDRVELVLKHYGRVAWIAVGLVVLFFVLRLWWRQRGRSTPRS